MNTSKQDFKAFIESFLDKRSRHNYLLDLEKVKEASEFMALMTDLVCLDERYCVKLPKGSREDDVRFVMGYILKFKLNGCTIYSKDNAINNKKFSINEALTIVVGSSISSLISFLPGKFAYYEGESPENRYVCLR
jgi:hypothetical protein